MLTRRQVEVLALLAEGLTYAQIGKRLYITRESVKTHVEHSFRALGARNAPHAVALAYRRGLLRKGAVVVNATATNVQVSA